MRDRKTIGIVVVVIAASIIYAFGDLTPGSPIAAVDCPFDAGAVDTNVTCFEVEVDGGSLSVAVLHRAGEALEAAPALLLPSEPGETPTFDLPELAELSLLEHRDIVVVDPAGSTRSTPTITCAGLEAGVSVDGLERCREDLVDADVRLDRFGTEAFLDDLVTVRSALEQGRRWRRWHLVGRGYGAQLAVRLAANDANGVETVTLSSAMPLDVPSYLARATAFEPALAALSQACAADGGCDRFESPSVTAGRIADRLARSPESVLVPGVDSARAEPQTFTDRTFRSDLSRALDVATLPEILPWALARIDGAASEFGLSRPGTNALAALEVATEARSTIDPVLWWTVVCAEQIDLVDAGTQAELWQATPELVAPVDPNAGCAVWAAAPRPSADVEPIDVPTLVFDADVDSAGSRTWTDQAAALAESPTVVRLPVAETVPGSTECTAEIMARFMDSPRNEPSTGCVEQALDFAGRPVPVGSVRQLGATGEVGPIVMAALGLLTALGFAGWAWLAAPGGRSRTAWLVAVGLGASSFVGALLILVMNPAPSGLFAQPPAAWLVFSLPWLTAAATAGAGWSTVVDTRSRIIGGHWPARYSLLGIGVTMTLLASWLLDLIPGL